MRGRGPLVPRSARWGGAILLVGALQFVVAMAVTQAAYPGYSDVANPISDLGHPTHSPWHDLFNRSVQVLGLLGIVGAYLLRPAFAPRRSARLGLALLAIAALGAIGVGAYPESSPQLGGQVHALVSLIAYLGAGAALVALGFAMLRDTRWEGLRGFTVLAGVVTLVALVAYAGGFVTTESAGLVERIVVAPILLWAIVGGLHLVRLPGYAPVRNSSLG